MWWISRSEWLALVSGLAHIQRTLERMEREMAVDYNRLRNDIAAQTSVISSVLALIAGLQQLIADLKTQLPDDSAAQAILDQASADLEANTAKIAAAVPVNTPSPATVTPTVVPPPEPAPVETPPAETPAA